MEEKSDNGDSNSENKRCEYIGEFPSLDPTNPFKICAYKCKGYSAIATFPWPKDKSCPPSFNGNFPGT